MNKIFSSILLISSAFAFTACVNEEAAIFDKSAAERLDEVRGTYSKLLVASKGGWVMEYYPTNEQEAYKGVGYLMTCKFNPDYSVVVGMNNEVTANFYKEASSVWEILTDNGPVLSFNSYNSVLHAFSSPEDNPLTTGDREDETGKGFEGDYEFVITSLVDNSDYAMLKGKKRGTYNRLTRLPEGTNFSAYIDDINKFVKSKFPEGANDLRLEHDGKLYFVSNMASMLPNVYPSDGDNVVNKDLRPYLVTKLNDKYYLRWRDAFGSDDTVEQEFVYDEDNDQFVGVENSKNVLRGITDDELPYYLSSVGGMSMGFGLTETVSRSDKFAGIINDITEGFPAYNKNYSLNSISLSVANEGRNLNLVVNYRVNRSNKSDVYSAPFVPNATGIEIKEWRFDSAADKLCTDIPQLKVLLDALQGEFDVRVVGSRLNISEMRFDKIGDSEFWFSSVCK